MIQDNYGKNEYVLKTIKLCRNVRYYDFNQLKVKPCGPLDWFHESVWQHRQANCRELK